MTRRIASLVTATALGAGLALVPAATVAPASAGTSWERQAPGTSWERLDQGTSWELLDSGTSWE